MNLPTHKAKSLDGTWVEGWYDRIKKLIEHPKPLKKPPYNCAANDDKKNNCCSYPNCLCEWFL